MFQFAVIYNWSCRKVLIKVHDGIRNAVSCDQTSRFTANRAIAQKTVCYTHTSGRVHWINETSKIWTILYFFGRKSECIVQFVCDSQFPIFEFIGMCSVFAFQRSKNLLIPLVYVTVKCKACRRVPTSLLIITDNIINREIGEACRQVQIYEVYYHKLLT